MARSSSAWPEAATKHRLRGTAMLRLTPPVVLLLLVGMAALLSSNSSTPRPDSSAAASAAAAADTLSPCAQQQTPAVPGFLTPDNCPAWMAEYAAWHKQTHGQPSARYLVFSVCPGKSGLGDRIRGMMYVTRLAVAAKRVVLFTWQNDPYEPQRFLQPAGDIDWRLEGLPDYVHPPINCSMHPADYNASRPLAPCAATSAAPGSNVTSLGLRAFNFKQYDYRARSMVKTAAFWRRVAGVKFVTLITQERASFSCEGCPPLAEPMAPSRDGVNASSACLFRHLFTPSADVLAAIASHKQRLFGRAAQQPGFGFVGLHLRLGGMANEEALKEARGSKLGVMADLISGLRCSRQLGQHAGVHTTTPALLLTDNHALRGFVQAGGLANVVTPAVTPTHLARMNSSEQTDAAAAMSVWVDLGLLASARCFVAGVSGFSDTAWMLGGGSSCVAKLGSTVSVAGECGAST